MKEASGPVVSSSASALSSHFRAEASPGTSQVVTECYREASRGPQIYSCRQGRLAGAEDRGGAGPRRPEAGPRGAGPDACAIKPAARTGTGLLRAAAPLSFLFRARPAPCTSRVPPWLRSPGTRSSRSCRSGTARTLPTSSCANFLSRIRSASTTSGARTGSGLPGPPSCPAGPRPGPHFVLDTSLEWVLGTRVLARGPRLLSHMEESAPPWGSLRPRLSVSAI